MSAQVEARLESPPGEVFDHLIEPDKLVRWWPKSAMTEPVPGRRYELPFAAPA